MASDLLSVFGRDPRFPWHWRALAVTGAERSGVVSQTVVVPRRAVLAGYYLDWMVGPTDLAIALTSVIYQAPAIETDAPPVLSGLAEGTRVTTARGEIAVESLSPGDLVLSPSVVLRKVREITPLRVDCAAYPRPAYVWPVRIAAGAIANRSPRRDLLVSPDLGIWIDGIVVPARSLVNGTTIVQEQRDEILYFQLAHISSGLALAEGVAFVSGPRPGDAAPPGPSMPADVVLRGPSGAELYGIRYKLAARAIELGVGPVAEQTLLLSGTGAHEAKIDPETVSVRLVSSTVTPPQDGRRLGAAIGDLRLDGIAIDVDDPRLQGGLYRIEGPRTRPFRWTNGEATLFLGKATTMRTLSLQVFATAANPGSATRPFADPIAHNKVSLRRLKTRCLCGVV